MSDRETRPPTRRLAREIASSCDLPPSLLPHLSYLFADLAALGSTPRRTAAMLEGLGLGSRSHIVDLACGKGALSVELARRFGCRCTGVDAFGPFIEHAAALARRRGVDHLCTFMACDLRRFHPARRADAALMIGLFPVPQAARTLRPLVRPGGIYVIDDAVAETCDGAMTLDDARAALQSGGDKILRESLLPRSATIRLNDSLYRRIVCRARALAGSQPRLRPAIREFLSRQRHANALLAGPIRPATWVVRRARD